MQLAATPFGDLLFIAPLREHVVALLELERQYCRLWCAAAAGQQSRVNHDGCRHCPQLDPSLIPAAACARSSQRFCVM